MSKEIYDKTVNASLMKIIESMKVEKFYERDPRKVDENIDKVFDEVIKEIVNKTLG